MKVNKANTIVSYLMFCRTPGNNQSTRGMRTLRLNITDRRIKSFRFCLYYLEKNRMVEHNSDETTFGIFRMLSEGMEEVDLTKYHIWQDTRQYNLIKKSLLVETPYKFRDHFSLFQTLLTVVSL